MKRIAASHEGFSYLYQYPKDVDKIQDWLWSKGYSANRPDIAYGWHNFCERYLATGWTSIGHNGVYELLKVLIEDEPDEPTCLSFLLESFIDLEISREVKIRDTVGDHMRTVVGKKVKAFPSPNLCEWRIEDGHPGLSGMTFGDDQVSVNYRNSSETMDTKES